MLAALTEWMRCSLCTLDPVFTFHGKMTYVMRDAVRKIEGNRVTAIYVILWDCEAEGTRMAVLTPENAPASA